MSTVHGNKSYAGVWGNKSLTLSYEHFHAAHEMRRRVGGELAASLAALQRLEVGSSIAREADDVIYTLAGPEIAVATTKAYSCQLVAEYLLAIKIARVRNVVSFEEEKEYVKDLLKLPEQIELLLNNKEKIQHFANRYLAAKDVFFIGRGIDYAISLEGSLKLKEISYIHSFAIAAGELKHGPIALIENGVTVIGIITSKELAPKSISNIQEVITRGAKTLIITNQILPNNNFNYVINIPDTNELISPILSVIPLQLLSYYISKNKGLDVDKPRNLAKSVTVE